jgi:hypothetical protein
MIRFWDTADPPTNANLGLLEGLGADWRGLTTEQALQKYEQVIGVRRMLPAVVARHFNFPFLEIGGEAPSWTPQRREERSKQLCDAINEGLDHVAIDRALQTGGGADFSDRPQTKGEAIMKALEVFQKAWPRGSWASELTTLEVSVSGTPMQSDVRRLRELLSAKRWSGPTSVEYEVYRVIEDVEGRASRYHHRLA